MTPLRAALRLLLAACAAALLVVVSAQAQAACPPDCAGQTLNTPNFSHLDLTGAHFENATIISGVFVRAKLNGAHFDGATFQSAPGHPTQTPDFTFADLTNATFVNARFLGPTYFTYATLTCADFSKTDLSNGNAVFGDEPLTYQAGNGCRTRFQGTTMNCEFIDDWHAFDLTGAVVTQCLARLAGRNFSGAMMDGVVFDTAILDGTAFTNASLKRAHFKGASLQCIAAGKCVDMTGAQMPGAQFNNANLTGASLYQAYLSNATGIPESASLVGAHLHNVNLASAQLSGTDFTSANFFGDFSALSGCKTSGPKNSGFTSGCASAHGATMDGTTFVDAYLFGVDFAGAAIGGVNFTNAVLAGANLDATIGTSITSGATTKFIGAYLQGTDLSPPTPLSRVDLTNAFLDFNSAGNTVYVELSPLHTTFPCSVSLPCTTRGVSICAAAFYPNPNTVPPANATITCPSGASGPCGNGEPGSRRVPSNPLWKSGLTIGTPVQDGPPPGWYSSDATYDKAAPDSIVCNGRGSAAAVSAW